MRVRIDGHVSMARSTSRENVNRQSLVYLDDKPHVIDTRMSGDGMHIYISFDVQVASPKEPCEKALIIQK